MKKLLIIISILFSFNLYAAMSASSCSTKVVTYLKTLNPEITGPAETQMIGFWTQICQGIIDEIQGNASVTVPGVQTGGSTVTGTIN